MAASTSHVMYLILRRDLTTALQWPLGAVCTQAAHAASASIWLFRDDPNTIAYTADLDHMHKVTLGVDSEEEIRKVESKLVERKIDHKVWIEDGFPVCIALKPYPKDEVKNALLSGNATLTQPHVPGFSPSEVGSEERRSDYCPSGFLGRQIRRR
ncbi:unnamed protein product [Caenorhabditis auriculariae]|uniref:peptidyl-tRNA hydrolase n=1 Tax=Caenorhabditis auriculariae TaxID=2777116 RepID=A0A8S1HPT1_9PELO|nr:unnamed protein product [Caenorhabditis auriculariae]